MSLGAALDLGAKAVEGAAQTVRPLPKGAKRLRFPSGRYYTFAAGSYNQENVDQTYEYDRQFWDEDTHVRMNQAEGENIPPTPPLSPGGPSKQVRPDTVAPKEDLAGMFLGAKPALPPEKKSVPPPKPGIMDALRKREKDIIEGERITRAAVASRLSNQPPPGRETLSEAEINPKGARKVPSAETGIHEVVSQGLGDPYRTLQEKIKPAISQAAGRGLMMLAGQQQIDDPEVERAIQRLAGSPASWFLDPDPVAMAENAAISLGVGALAKLGGISRLVQVFSKALDGSEVGAAINRAAKELSLTPEQIAQFKSEFRVRRASEKAAERASTPQKPHGSPGQGPTGAVDITKDLENQFVDQNWRRMVEADISEMETLLKDPAVSQNHKRKIRAALGQAKTALAGRTPPPTLGSTLRKQFRRQQPAGPDPVPGPKIPDAPKAQPKAPISEPDPTGAGGAVDEAESFAASNAAGKDLRESVGLGPVEETPKVGYDAKSSYSRAALLSKVKKIVADVRDGKRAPVATQEEIDHLAMLDADLKRDYNQVLDDMTRGIEAGEDVSHLRHLRDQLQDEIETATQANKYVGTEQSRAFSQRNAAILDDYTSAGLYRGWTASAERKLTPKEAGKAESLGKAIEDLQRRVQDLEAKRAASAAEAEMGAAASGGSKAAKGTIEAIRQRRSAAVKRISEKWANRDQSLMSDAFGAQTVARGAKFLGEIAPDVKEIARTLYDEGVVKLEEVVAGIRGTLKESGVDLEDQDIHRILGGEYEHKPRTVSEAAKQAADWRKEAKTLPDVQRAALERKIADMDARIAKGEFPERPKPTPYDKELRDLEIDLEAKRVEAEEIREALRAEREYQRMDPGGKLFLEVANGTRSLLASGDLSAPFNQGAFFLMSHLPSSVRATKAMFEALKSEDALRRLIAENRLSPHFNEALSAGLEIKATRLGAGDEFFTSRLLSRAPVISATERAYSAYLGKLRLDVFSNLVDSMERPWLGRFGVKEKLTKDELKQVAEYVNTATGVGTGRFAEGLKHFNRKTPLMFAPGYRVSRWKLAMGTPAFNAAIRGNKKLAAQIAKDYLVFSSSVAGSLYMMKTAGYEVGLDPRSSTFGKIRMGDTWTDPFGGILVPFRMAYQQGGKKIKQADGDLQKASPETTTGFYLWGGATPLARLGKNLVTGEDFGRPINVTSWEGGFNIFRSLLPINVQTQIELFEDKKLTPEQQFVLRLASVFGGNVDVKTPKLSKQR